LIGRTADQSEVPYVDADFEATGEMAVEHLAGLGHRDIVFLSQSQESLDAGLGPLVRSRDALIAAGREHGMRVHVFSAASTGPAGRDVLDRILETAPQVTAIAQINEAATLGLIAAATERGMKIPEDLSIIALNASDDAAELSRPALTSISPDHRRIARLATHYLVRRLRSEDFSSFQTLVPPQLTVRDSTRPARKVS
jgi:DNA-binding LacI/PurR family transcriptional regulator